MKEELLRIIKERRSIRKFTPEKVDRSLIDTILEAGRWAPSGLNNQPWRFVLVLDDEEKRSSLAQCTKYGKIIQGAPALIVVLIDREVMYNPTKDYQAIGACIQNMLLTIHALELGGVWLGEILNQAEKVLSVLGIDKNRYELMAVIALGHPAREGSSHRKPLTELILEEY